MNSGQNGLIPVSLARPAHLMATGSRWRRPPERAFRPRVFLLNWEISPQYRNTRTLNWISFVMYFLHFATWLEVSLLCLSARMVATLGLASSQGLCVYQTKTPPFPTPGIECAPTQPRDFCLAHSLASALRGGPAGLAPSTIMGVWVQLWNVPTEFGPEAVYRE